MKIKKKYLSISLLSILLSTISPAVLSASSGTTQSSTLSTSTAPITSTESSTSYSESSSTASSSENISEESTVESSNEVSSDSSATNVPEYLKNDPYFPTNPTVKDVLDDAILPFTTNYSEWDGVSLADRISADSSRSLSDKNKTIVTYPLAKIVTNYTPNIITHQEAYADGVGKPRGIVIHETANPSSTIQNEITYMRNNWKSAFVHAFVDQNNIIEVAPTQYIAWGAGRKANPYYIHVELVEHVGNRTAFYKSINNQTYYAAYNLKKYNLTPSRAQSNGTGSVWGHFEVSNYLGGTDHGDPLAYLATFGYTYQELYDLIAYHYNNTLSKYAIVTSEKNVNFDGIFKSSVSNYGIHNKPWNTIDSTILSYATPYASQRITVTKEATTSFGETYYYFKKDGKEIGWVNKNALQPVDQILSQTAIDTTAEILSPTQVGNLASYVNIPGTEIKDTTASNNSIEQGQVVKIVEKAVTSKGIFYKYQLNNSSNFAYYSEKALKIFDAIEYDRSVNKSGMVLPDRSSDLITQNIYNTAPNEVFLGTGKDYANQKVAITREAKTAHASWYQFTVNGQIIGWMNQRAFKIYDTLISKNEITESKVLKSATELTNYNLYSQIPNIGENETILAKSSNYANRKVIATQISKTSGGTYYYIEDISGNNLGWISGDALSPYNGITTVLTSTHVQNIGWQSPVGESTTAGTTGKNLQVEAIKMQLQGAEYSGSIEYTTHVENLGWLDWAKNGESAGTQGHNYHVEAIKTILVKKNNPAPGNTTTPFRFAAPKLSTRAHVSEIGWQLPVSSGQISGTVGRALAMEAFSIKLTNSTPYEGSIKYQAHVTNNGWLPFVNGNSISGTTGQRKSLQAISIELTGSLADYYDIFYRVHVRNKGWLDWTKNGEKAGSVGMNLSAEAIQVTLLEKGKTPSGYSSNGLALLGQVDDATSSGKFINSIVNTVQTIAPTSGLYSSVMLAQAVLESGYGTSKLAREANNFFGMKFKEEDEGIYDFIEYTSDEELPGGIITPIVSKFRKYGTQRESFLDNALKLTQGVPWDSLYYAGTWRKNCRSYKDATASLQGRYATSSTYATSLNSVISRWRLDQFD